MEMETTGISCKLTFYAYNKKYFFLILDFKYLNLVVTIIGLQKEGVMI
jgi:hypothetical protein